MAVLVLVFLVGQVLFGATQIGNSNDDPGHQARTNHWLEVGWYLPGRFFEDGSLRPDIETGRLHAYGAGYSIFAHVLAAVVGAEPWGATANTAAVYIVRHGAVALLGVSAALAVGYALLVVTGRRMVGAWAAAATLAMPLWTGYSMFAVKDIPAAAGWTFVTAALVVALVPKPGRWRPTAVGLLSFAGVWFAVGTRTALWVPVAVATVTFGILVAFSPARRQLLASVIAAAVGLVAGLIGVAALHYRNVVTPVQWLLSSVRTSGDFPRNGLTLTAGQMVPTKPPWWYLPAWLGGSVPLLLGLLAVAGIALLAVALVRRPSRESDKIQGRLGHCYAGMLLWAQQALLLPIASIVIGATMYAGLRQHVYILPALAAMAGLAAHWVTQRYHRGWRGAAVAALLIAAITVPAWEQTLLFPYNYVYKNVAAGTINDRWETDNQWVSSREAVSYVPSGERANCYTRGTRTRTGDVVDPQIRRCQSRQQVGVFLYQQGRNAAQVDAPDQVWVLAPKYNVTPPARGCREQSNVTRWFRGEEVDMSYVLLCDASLLEQE